MADSPEPQDNRVSAAVASAQAEQPRIFVSYASPDVAIASELVEALEQHGISCWIAPRDVKPGALYADAIIRAINVAPAVVLVLSESSIASTHVGKEIERASSKNRPLLALRIDAAPLTPAFEYFLSESQWIEALSGIRDGAYRRLIDTILGPGPTSTAAIPSASSPTKKNLASQIVGWRKYMPKHRYGVCSTLVRPTCLGTLTWPIYCSSAVIGTAL
jgi:hypothetical protein